MANTVAAPGLDVQMLIKAPSNLVFKAFFDPAALGACG
jgi:hypothetical protein